MGGVGPPLLERKNNLILATFENDKNPNEATIAALANVLHITERRVKVEFARLRANSKKEQYRNVLKVNISRQ